jgi:hypothetical protein
MAFKGQSPVVEDKLHLIQVSLHRLRPLYTWFEIKSVEGLLLEKD